MLQNDFEHRSGQFGPKLFSGHKSLVYETDLDRATANIEAQDAVRSLTDGLAHYFQDLATTRLKRFYSVPGFGAGIGYETYACQNQGNQNGCQ